MLYGSIEVFTFGLDVDVLRFFWGALSACVVAAVWLGDGKEAGTDEAQRTRERLETAFHTFSNLVSLYVSQRDAVKDAAVESTTVGEGLSDLSNERQDSSDAESRVPRAQTGDIQDVKINAVDFWREDYWNFELNLEGDLFAADEEEKQNEDAWKESLKEEEKKEESREEEEQEKDEQNKGRANYFGTFFRNRDYPPDVTDPDVQERMKERDANATPRWRRPKELRDETLDVGSSGVDESAVSSPDLDATDQNSEDWEEPVVWNQGPNFDYLENDSVSLDDKIVYLRKRVDDGDEESRVELARFLIQKAAISSRNDEKKVLEGLDEAERVLREVGACEESNVYDDGEYSELLGQVLLQRPVFYLRNGLKPPMKTANDALNQIRSWAESSFSIESRRLLATAWQTHGNCLFASGGESSALSSFRESRETFESLLEEGCDEVEPSLAFVATSTAETYLSIGDFPKALDSYREALKILDKYSDQEAFLAEKVNVFFKMSSVYRRAGDDESALRSMRDALDSEERLVSFNEGVYFAPLAQLLEAYAELLASTGCYEDAVASLDRAVSTLKRVLAYDSALSRRVLAYAHIENVLRRRATLYLWQERYAHAAEDVEESLEYLTLAIKKEDAFDPSLQIVFSSCLLFDLCASQELWDYASQTQGSLDQILERFTPEERKRVALLYAQLLMQRHMLLARAERESEALKAADDAIRVLEALQDEDLEDGGAFRNTLLSKAYCQRATFRERSNENKKNKGIVRDDYRRARELSDHELAGGKADAAFYSFYIDLLGQKAAAELRDNLLDAAQEDLRRSVSILVGLLNARRWRFLDEFLKTSRLVVVWAREWKNASFALRVVRLFLAYARRLRRRYVENDWLDDEQESDSLQERTVLLNLETCVVDLRRARADLLESDEWNDEFAQYCAPCEFGSRVSSRRDLDSTEGNVDVPTFDLEEARARFVREVLADDPKTRTIFLDYEYGLRVLARRVASGKIETSNALYRFLDKTTDVFIARNENFLAAEETSEIVKIFDDILEKRNYELDQSDVSESNVDEEEIQFWASAFPFWELQATLLARTSVDALEARNAGRNDESGDERDSDESQRAVVADLLLRVASMRTEAAYKKTIRCAKKNLSCNPFWIARFGVVVSSYFAWLARMDRFEEGVAFTRGEGESLERRFGGSIVGFFPIAAYYEALSNVAIEFAEGRNYAKERLLKANNLLTGNKTLLKGLTAPPLLERLASIERRLAKIASEEGNEEEADKRLRASADYYARIVFKSRFQKQVFDGFAEVLGALFNSNSAENQKLASVLFHRLEKRAKSWIKKARRESFAVLWTLTSQAASYYGSKRGCFYEANRIYRARDAFIAKAMTEARNFNFHLVDEKFGEAIFYIENDVGDRAIEALETAIAVRRIHILTLLQFKILAKFEDDAPLIFAFDGFQREIDCASVNLAELEIWRLGNKEKARNIVEESLPSMEQKPEVAARVLPSDQKTKRFVQLGAELSARFAKFFRKKNDEEESAPTKRLIEDESNEYLQSYFMMRGYAAILDVETSGYDRARESLLKLTQEIRLNLGRNSQTERTCLYYWADAAIESKRWSDAIRFASRLFRRGKAPRNDAEPRLPFYVDALKISAFARLQRRRFGDLRRAEREVKRALELIYSEFRARRFTLRSSFAEALFLRAVIARAQGRKEEALKDAERAARLMERARKRGVGQAPRYVEAQTEPFLTSLRAELNANVELQEGGDSAE